MNDKPKTTKQYMKPGDKALPVLGAMKLLKAFHMATAVTRAYTLSRDVQDIVDEALRREKRS